MKKNTLKVGLIAGRHPMPVDTYIFEDIPDVLDFGYIRKGIFAFLEANCGLRRNPMGCGLNQADYTSVETWEGTVRLEIYVTGLTAVTAELIRDCALNGVSLTLMHFDRDTGNYVPQVIF